MNNSINRRIRSILGRGRETNNILRTGIQERARRRRQAGHAAQVEQSNEVDRVQAVFRRAKAMRRAEYLAKAAREMVAREKAARGRSD